MPQKYIMQPYKLIGQEQLIFGNNLIKLTKNNVQEDSTNSIVEILCPRQSFDDYDCLVFL